MSEHGRRWLTVAGKLYDSKILGIAIAVLALPGLVGGALSGHNIITAGAAAGFAFRATVLVGFVSPAVLCVAQS